MNPEEDIRDCLLSAWEHALSDDVVEPDLELIAAYVDGDLSPEEESFLAEHILESPVAFDLLVDSLAQGQRLPVAGVQEFTSSSSTHQNVERKNSVRMPRLWQLVAVVGIAATLGITSFVNELRTKNQFLVAENFELRDVRQKLLNAESFALAQIGSARRPIYVGSGASTELLSLALNSITGIRSVKPITEPELQQTEHALRRTNLAIGSSNRVQEVVQRAIALIWAGHFDEASSILNEQQSANHMGLIANAEDILHATQYEELTQDEAEKAAQQAIKSFSSAAESGVSVAWLNLAIFHVSRDEPEEAKSAAQKFLRTSKDSEAKAKVAEWLGD